MNRARLVKGMFIAFATYVGLVVLVETALGVGQPDPGDTIVIATRDAEGRTTERVLARNESQGRLYASANHWPRAWYREALADPRIRVTIDGVTADYEAVPISAEERAQIWPDIGNPVALRFLFGFAPQRFLRLDPAEPPALP